jgi:hypothetical protein
MSWTLDCVIYWVSLKEKGWFDESFYTEYNWICCELVRQNYPELEEQTNTLQAQTLLHRKELK